MLQDFKIWKLRISGCWLGKNSEGGHGPVRNIVSKMIMIIIIIIINGNQIL